MENEVMFKKVFILEEDTSKRVMLEKHFIQSDGAYVA
jgi:hypothetical protein